MNLFFKKRITISLAFALLCTSATPVKTDNNASNTLLTSSAIAAGIVGICSLMYKIVQSYKKSPEQIANDAQEALNMAHMYGQCFYTEYVNTFEQAHLGSNIEYVEHNFLEAVMRHAQEPEVNIDIETYINAVSYAIDSLEEALKGVSACVEDLKSRKTTDQLIYDRLVTIIHKSEAELAYLKAYRQRFAEHRAYFALAACEAKLLEKYKDAIVGTNLDSIVWELFVVSIYDPEQLVTKETQLLHIAKMHNANSNYPFVQYYLQLCNDIATLDYCIRSLTNQYSKIHATKNLWHQLSMIREIIADDHVFKEEYKRKKEDDAQREILERTRKALQKSMDDNQKAIIEQQHAHRNKTATTSQPSSSASSTNADNSQITIDVGNSKRTVSVEWYEQNKPGAVNIYIE